MILTRSNPRNQKSTRQLFELAGFCVYGGAMRKLVLRIRPCLTLPSLPGKFSGCFERSIAVTKASLVVLQNTEELPVGPVFRRGGCVEVRIRQIAGTNPNLRKSRRQVDGLSRRFDEGQAVVAGRW